MSLLNGLTMIMRRKEKKTYGTKQILEGKYKAGQTCLIIEDVITSGASVTETADDLEAVGLNINDVVVFIDREQGGKANLQKRHYTVHAAVTLTEILGTLMRSNQIDETERHIIQQYLHAAA
jgi:orotate phosphoribosyltransferase